MTRNEVKGSKIPISRKAHLKVPHSQLVRIEPAVTDSKAIMRPIEPLEPPELIVGWETCKKGQQIQEKKIKFLKLL